jgi:hypothetical protein
MLAALVPEGVLNSNHCRMVIGKKMRHVLALNSDE